MSKKIVLISLVAIVFVIGLSILMPIYNNASAVALLVERNLEARGGADKWKNVTSMRITGQMDLGKGISVPYTLDQQRPNKMCLEFVFNEQETQQCSSGNSGWKIVPFRGRNRAEPMTVQELKDSADSSDLYGLLYDYSARDHQIEILGHETIDTKDVIKLKITLPKGAVRWLYLDSQTALEIKLESLRKVRGKPRLVETYYKDWQATENGLLISRRQESKTQGDDTFHFLTLEKITINPKYSLSRFDLPATEKN